MNKLTYRTATYNFMALDVFKFLYLSPAG